MRACGFALTLVCIAVTGFVCNDLSVDPAPLHPLWVDSLIATYASEPVGNPPRAIWQYTYKGATVYFVPAQCCDQYSDLYDFAGEVIGHPDGGISGSGDGRCSDFITTATAAALIWRDQRSRN